MGISTNFSPVLCIIGNQLNVGIDISGSVAMVQVIQAIHCVELKN